MNRHTKQMIAAVSVAAAVMATLLALVLHL